VAKETILIYNNYMLTTENKQILIKRAQSLVWRSGAMLSVMVVDFAATNIGLLELSPEVVVFAGLVLGEVSKYLNNRAIHKV